MAISQARSAAQVSGVELRASEAAVVLVPVETVPAERSPRRKPTVSALGAPVVRMLKRVATQLPLRRQAELVTQLLPSRLWYRAAVTISRAQGRLVERMGGNRILTTELMLDFWLRELSFGGPYPIPYRCKGLHLVMGTGAKLLTWTHLPLTEFPLRSYCEGGAPPLAVVSDPGKIVGENEFPVFGWPARVEAIPTDARLLKRVMATLRGGKTVVFLADHYLAGPMSDVPVRLAGRMAVPLVFISTEFAKDGVMDVLFSEAPYPYSRNEEEVAANMGALREARDRALTRLGWSVLPES